MILNGSDQYPSRKSNEVTLIERHDPVVRGDADDGPLGQELLDEFDARGFIQMDDVFTPGEVAAMSRELDVMAARPGVREDDACIIEPGGDDVRSIFHVSAFSDLLAKVLRDPRVADVARQILGSDVYLHQSRINYKPGFVGNAFEWHSDFETWHVEDGMPRPRAVSASIALKDNHEQNGPLLVMPGSHWTYVTCVGQTPEDLHEQSLQQPEYGIPDDKSLTILAERHGIESCKGLAGSVVFFDANCMHGSNGNITPYPRSNVFAVFNSVENTLEDPFGPTEPRPDHIASRDFTPLEPSAAWTA
jgi:ectoine hydroxylase